MKILFSTLFLSIALFHFQVAAQNYTPAEEFKYRTQKAEHTIDQFKDDTLPIQCSKKSQAIYSISKALKEKIENAVETSDCPTYISVDYSDIRLIQKAFGTNTGKNIPLTETYGIYVEQVCRDNHKVIEMSWEIKGDSPSCVSSTYVNGIHQPSKKGTDCSMSEYLKRNESWITDRIIAAF
ncbi:MAG: hypothetical protein R2877_00655 [Bdellovibrionota bacterium]